MQAVLEQLGLDKTFFIQLAIFAVLFVVLGRVYFRPFMKLFELRHKRTVEDREAAEKLMAQADARFEEYRRRLAEERLAAKKEYDVVIAEAKKTEADLLADAREKAKRATQEAVEAVARQREEAKRQLEADVDALARGISEKLLSRKV